MSKCSNFFSFFSQFCLYVGTIITIKGTIVIDEYDVIANAINRDQF